jgi:ParB family chromosome partitioning protein
MSIASRPTFTNREPASPRKNFDELAVFDPIVGILQPIIVEARRLWLWPGGGERRWRAAQRAGLLKVPAIVREIPDEAFARSR